MVGSAVFPLDFASDAPKKKTVRSQRLLESNFPNAPALHCSSLMIKAIWAI